MKTNYHYNNNQQLGGNLDYKQQQIKYYICMYSVYICMFICMYTTYILKYLYEQVYDVENFA